MSAPNRTADVLRTALTLQEVFSVRVIRDTTTYVATALSARVSIILLCVYVGLHDSFILVEINFCGNVHTL